MAWPDVVAFADPFTLLSLYIVVGVLAYGQLESLNLLDALYFQITTCTTVGFGDVVPTSPVGRIFTCIYTPIGTVLMFKAFYPYGVMVMQLAESLVKHLPGLASQPETLAAENPAPHAQQCIAIVLGPLALLLVGAEVFHFFFGYDLSQAFYFAFSCVSTIGFGDVVPLQMKAKLAVLAFIGVGFGLFCVILERIYLLGKRHEMRTTDHTKYVAELLLQASCWDVSRDGPAKHGAKADAEGLSEGEFLLAVLTAHDVVDVPTLVALRREYAHIIKTREESGRGGDGGDGSENGGSGGGAASEPRADARAVFARHVSDGRVRQRAADAPVGTHLQLPSDGPKVMHADDKIATVDLSAADGGFAEWRQHFWLERVEAVRKEAAEEAAEPAQGEAQAAAEAAIPMPTSVRPTSSEFLRKWEAPQTDGPELSSTLRDMLFMPLASAPAASAPASAAGTSTAAAAAAPAALV